MKAFLGVGLLLAVSAFAQGHQATMNWDYNLVSGQDAPTGFVLQSATALAGPYTTISSPSYVSGQVTYNFVDTTVQAGRTYYYRVSAQAVFQILLTVNPTPNSSIGIGGKSYRYVSSLTGCLANDVLIGAANTNTAQNLNDAVNAVTGSGTEWCAGTIPTTGVSATVSSSTVTVTEASAFAGPLAATIGINQPNTPVNFKVIPQ